MRNDVVMKVVLTGREGVSLLIEDTQRWSGMVFMVNYYISNISNITDPPSTKLTVGKMEKQAGAELCQAQAQLSSSIRLLQFCLFHLNRISHLFTFVHSCLHLFTNMFTKMFTNMFTNMVTNMFTLVYICYILLSQARLSWSGSWVGGWVGSWLRKAGNKAKLSQLGLAIG